MELMMVGINRIPVGIKQLQIRDKDSVHDIQFIGEPEDDTRDFYSLWRSNYRCIGNQYPNK